MAAEVSNSVCISVKSERVHEFTMTDEEDFFLRRVSSLSRAVSWLQGVKVLCLCTVLLHFIMRSIRWALKLTHNNKKKDNWELNVCCGLGLNKGGRLQIYAELIYKGGRAMQIKRDFCGCLFLEAMGIRKKNRKYNFVKKKINMSGFRQRK